MNPTTPQDPERRRPEPDPVRPTRRPDLRAVAAVCRERREREFAERGRVAAF